MAKIVYFTADTGACRWYRCLTPGDELKRRGHEVTVSAPVRRSLVDWADVVVFQRRHEADVPTAIDDARKKGKLAIYELDDDIWNIHCDSPAHAFFANDGVRFCVEESIRRADLVTVTTEALRDRIRSLNHNIKILPNMLPDEFWPNTPKEQDPDDVVIGWAGSDTHFADLKLLSGTIGQLLDRYPHVEFVTAGMSKLPFQRHSRIRQTTLKGGLEHYADLIRIFDIGLAPLVDTTFNRSKSDLKYLEYAAAGIPVVASRVTSYENSIRNGWNGFLASNDKDWLKYLSRLIEDVDLRRQIGIQAQETARKRFISRNVDLWEEAYGLQKAVGIGA